MFDFPSSPANGQTFIPTVGGPAYVWDGIAWKLSSGGLSGSVFIGDTPPANPVHGQLWWESDSGNTFIYYQDGSSGQWVQFNIQGGPAGYALPRNRVVNGGMQISQENGSNGSTANSYFAADQWYSSFSHGGSVTASRAASDTGTGSQFCLAAWVTTPDTSIGATDNYSLRQDIEGIRIADFMWGTASARQVVLRFGFLGPPGTYAVSLLNAAADRSYIAAFTADGTRQTHTIVIPGDTTGVWPKTNVRSMYLIFSLMCGANYLKAPGSWGAGTFLGATGMSNGLGATSASVGGFNIYDVGLYVDPENTGRAPPWEMPDEAEELAACQRYWQRFDHGGIYLALVTSVTQMFINSNFTPMRTTPAIGNLPTSNNIYNATGAAATAGTKFEAVIIGTTAIRLWAAHTANMTGIIALNGTLNARL